MQTYAEHRAHVDEIRADMFAAARDLHLTEDEKSLVRYIAEHGPDAMQALTGLHRRVA